jgi:hypothetical protein
VDRVLQPALVAMDPRWDGLPGGIGNSIAVQSPEGWSFVSAQDSGSKKISAMALNSTRPERGSSLILYRGAVVMLRCSSKARSLPVRIGDSAPKDYISVHFLVFGIARGMVLFDGQFDPPDARAGADLQVDRIYLLGPFCSRATFWFGQVMAITPAHSKTR